MFKFSQRTIISLILVAIMIFPLSASAQFSCVSSGSNPPLSPPSDFKEFVCVFVNFMDSAFPILVAATLLVFFWGLAKFILAAGDEKKVTDGKILMFSGTIALFVMVSVWGIIYLFYGDIIGIINPGTIPLLPSVQ